MSVETIYKGFGGKPGLVRALCDRVITSEVTVEEAADVLWTCSSVGLYELLVLNHGTLRPRPEASARIGGHRNSG